jgi:hypothetical protein
LRSIPFARKQKYTSSAQVVMEENVSLSFSGSTARRHHNICGNDGMKLPNGDTAMANGGGPAWGA